MSVLTYQPWLFDNYEAWSKACADPRWKYDLPISSFMSLYAEYRANASSSNYQTAHFAPTTMGAMAPIVPKTDSFLSAPSKPAAAPSPPPPASASEASQILSQSEIDSLLGMLSG